MKHKHTGKRIEILVIGSPFPTIEAHNQQLHELRTVLDHHNIIYHVSPDETDDPDTQAILMGAETDAAWLQNILDSLD